jgi:hypothetical protein
MFANWKLLANQTAIGQSRSSVLNPLQWVLVILLLGLGILVMAKADSWIIIGVGVCAFLDLAVLFAAYLYFMFKDPAALRSEGFSLQKLALEKGLVGDSLQGLKTIDAVTASLVVTAPEKKVVHEEQQGS